MATSPALAFLISAFWRIVQQFGFLGRFISEVGMFDVDSSDIRPSYEHCEQGNDSLDFIKEGPFKQGVQIF
jgi:hypothetical protein